MNWKIKAIIQSTIALIPEKLGNNIYLKIQKNFGGLKDKNIFNTKKAKAAKEIWLKIVEQNTSPKEKTFLELGTGRIPELPIYLWLFGAKNIMTVDLNRLLDIDLTNRFLEHLSKSELLSSKLLGGMIDSNKKKSLIEGNIKITKSSDLDKYFSINYIAPYDATKEILNEKNIDFFISYTVLEHIPKRSIESIMKNINKSLSKETIQVHFIDYSDHFSHSDTNISKINFLKFTNLQWRMIAGNRYMYMNRLRHDDYLSLFNNSPYKVVNIIPYMDPKCLYEIENKIIKLNNIFAKKENKINATTSSWFVLKKK